MKKFVQPEDVTSPRQHWSLIKVLYKGDEEEYSIALGRWDNKPCLGVRWNACEWRPVGNPHSRGLPTWFIIPKPLEAGVLASIKDGEMQRFAQTVLAE